MKKTFYLLVLFLATFKVVGQETEKVMPLKKNIVKTDVTGLLLTQTYGLNASYERLFGKKTSMQFELDLNKRYQSDISFRNFELYSGLSFRYYFNKNAYQMKGFYLAPIIESNFKHNTWFSHYYYQNVRNILDVNVGLQTGYQFNYKKKWVIDLYGGVTKNIYHKNWNHPRYTHHSQFNYRFGVKIGFKF